MGNTMQDLGNTIKEAKAQLNHHDDEEYAEDFDDSQQQHQESMQEMSQQQEVMMSGFVEGDEGDMSHQLMSDQ